MFSNPCKSLEAFCLHLQPLTAHTTPPPPPGFGSHTVHTGSAAGGKDSTLPPWWAVLGRCKQYLEGFGPSEGCWLYSSLFCRLAKTTLVRNGPVKDNIPASVSSHAPSAHLLPLCLGFHLLKSFVAFAFLPLLSPTLKEFHGKLPFRSRQHHRISSPSALVLFYNGFHSSSTTSFKQPTPNILASAS